MTVDEFLLSVEGIAAARPAYRPGGKGDDGTCDCIGLVIGAVERCGGRWQGIHGSNWAARNAVSGLEATNAAAALYPGDVVFKARAPEDPAWALPSRYAGDADQRDYYHAGVVTQADPLRITHCTSPEGIVIDEKLGSWRFRARLSVMDKEKGETIINEFCTVCAVSGSTVNLRKAPGGSLLARVPLGSRVEKLETYGDWTRIRWKNQEGWMKSEFLRASPADDLTARIDALEKRVSALEGGGS